VRWMGSAISALRLVHLYPGLMGRYGHQGNALILAQRSRWRGVECEIVPVAPGEPIPSQADLYLLAGGDTPGVCTLAALLLQQQGLRSAVQRGAVLLAIGSGFQVLGHSLRLRSGQSVAGLGLLDAHSEPARKRRYGPVVADPLLPIEAPLLGFEDHQRIIRLGAESHALARLRCGEGNGAGQGTEGAWQSSIVATSLRGPVLALNPGLADALLSRLLGPLSPLPMLAVDRLRERFLRGLPRRCASATRR
jgi:CobQ-like glutamine amidotransferase family enzyme